MIESLSALLERSPHDPAQAARLEVLRETTGRLRELMLDELREGVDESHGLVRLDEVAREAASELAAFAIDRGVELNVSVAPSPLAGDRRLLEEAIRNVLLNAIEASPPGAIVSIDVRSTHDRVELTCANDERRTPRSRHNISTGLGLPITRRIVASHLGTTSFERRDDRVFVVLRFGIGLFPAHTKVGRCSNCAPSRKARITRRSLCRPSAATLRNHVPYRSHPAPWATETRSAASLVNPNNSGSLRLLCCRHGA